MGAAGACLAGLCETPGVEGGRGGLLGADSSRAAGAGPDGCPGTAGGPFWRQ